MTCRLPITAPAQCFPDELPLTLSFSQRCFSAAFYISVVLSQFKQHTMYIYINKHISSSGCSQST